MTEREAEVLRLAIEWRDSRYAVKEAIIENELKHAIDMLKKERRDEQSEKTNKNEVVQPFG